jgi:hypothetical protein
MNRCNRSLRSCTNYRRRIRGDYRLRELPFMQQHSVSSAEPQFARELARSLCENLRSRRRTGGEQLRRPYSPSYIANPLNATSSAVSVALTDQNDHATKPRLSELQRPACLLFVIEPHDLELSNIWLIWARVGLRSDHSCEFSISAIRKLWKAAQKKPKLGAV